MDDGGFKFYQTGLICKVLKATWMEHCNGFPITTKVEATIGKDDNSYKANIYYPNSYASVIFIVLYLSQNTIPDIYSGVHQCAQFTHNTKASHKKSVKRIFQYLQGTKDNVMMFNTYKKLVEDCYSDAYLYGAVGT